MPVWKIYHHPSVFQDKSERQSLVQGITKIYTSRNLPAYYVNIQFWPLTAEDFYTAGTGVSKTVFIEVLHIARHVKPNDKATQLLLKDQFDAVLKPYTIDRGLHLEYAINESSPALWRINGIDPPESFGPDEQEQAELNRVKLDELRKNVL